MNPRRLFVASCISLVATAMAFAIRGDIMGALRLTFELDATQVGAIASAAFLGFALSIFIGGPLCDAFGMGRLLGLACFFHISGVIMTIFAPGFGLLWLATLIVGFGNGLVEAVINPLAATMYPDQKTHKLNVLHSWWPGGQITAGVLAYALTRWLTPDAATATPEQIKFAWQVKMALIVIAAVIYGILILGQKFPPTERVASNVSTADISAGVHPVVLHHVPHGGDGVGSDAVGPQHSDGNRQHQRDPGLDLYQRADVCDALFRRADCPQNFSHWIVVVLLDFVGDRVVRVVVDSDGADGVFGGDGLRDRDLLFLADDVGGDVGALSEGRGAAAGPDGHGGQHRGVSRAADHRADVR